ncbi:MAG: hypothetical protein ABSH24_28770, partial [Bryobacteraceae bacterium]
DEHTGAQLDGRRRLGILEYREKGIQCAATQVVEPVAAGENEFGAGDAEGGGELLMVLDPAVNGDAMDAVSFSGAGKS